MHNAIRAKSAPLAADAVIITDEGIYTDPWAGPVKYAAAQILAFAVAMVSPYFEPTLTRELTMPGLAE
jgi:hypothetical protein